LILNLNNLVLIVLFFFLIIYIKNFQGYYLAAGEILTVTAKTPIEEWHIRIGCHADPIFHKDSWPRYPVVTKQEKLVSSTQQFTSPYGGLIYLVSSGSSTSITVELGNVVKAAFYDINNPSISHWDVNAPAPIAEIQGAYLTMSVPITAIKNLADPKPVAEYWDKIVERFYDLRTTPIQRRERFVADIEIGGGYMHSGYPIMTYLDVVTVDQWNPVIPHQLNVESLSKTGSWGFFHELGHNLQRGWWTMEGAGEVTNNVFSLYGGYICCNISVMNNEWMNGRYLAVANKINQYVNKSKDVMYSWFKSEPGPYLVQYALLINKFGFDVMRTAFQSYEPDNGPKPEDNQDKIDTWVVQISKAVGKNLLPYFEIFKLPISTAGVARVNQLGLPLWMPPSTEFPYNKISSSYLRSIRNKYKL
jgi:hypothetical protein